MTNFHHLEEQKVFLRDGSGELMSWIGLFLPQEVITGHHLSSRYPVTDDSSNIFLFFFFLPHNIAQGFVFSILKLSLDLLDLLGYHHRIALSDFLSTQLLIVKGTIVLITVSVY